MAAKPSTYGQIVAKSVGGVVSTSAKSGVIAQTASGSTINRNELGFIPVIQNASKISNEQFAGTDACKSGKKKKK